jgi:pimeloyl-ACP methyl ester carboxylesterase
MVMRHTSGLILAMNLAGFGSLSAQNPVCSPAAVTADSSPVDTAYPPAMRTVAIPSGGVRDEKNLDLAQAVRRAGFNALVFYYRGAWGSPGTYSYSHLLEDVTAALSWLRAPAVADAMRVDPARLILVGHSLGGFAALYTAATRDDVGAVAALAPVDLGRRGAALRDSVAFAKAVRRRRAQLGALRGTSGEELSREALSHADQWSLQRYVGVLSKKRVLLLAATQDEAVASSKVFEPLGSRLRAAGARELTTVTLPADHLFSSTRIRLAQTVISWLCESE